MLSCGIATFLLELHHTDQAVVADLLRWWKFHVKSYPRLTPGSEWHFNIHLKRRGIRSKFSLPDCTASINCDVEEEGSPRYDPGAARFDAGRPPSVYIGTPCYAYIHPYAMQQILQGYQGSDLSDIMRHVSGQDPAMLEAVINAVSDAKEKNQVDLSTFNYASLRVKRDSFWVVQLTQMGFGDPRTGRLADDQFPGSQPVFQIVICAFKSPGI